MRCFVAFQFRAPLPRCPRRLADGRIPFNGFGQVGTRINSLVSRAVAPNDVLAAGRHADFALAMSQRCIRIWSSWPLPYDIRLLPSVSPRHADLLSIPSFSLPIAINPLP
ncbi:hypothetical protein CBM2592_B40085 [Cupriavidus taiwanensis]|nr:hypothetical protein CBM2592_B40085 [Cupriavidus taiwanensis]SOY70616.1 hypothetical protein CBM2588_B30086 [Cupriavidus taiwanensis]SOY95516.1 hypothetical protein CBM2591_B20087 [Cupriavidus taiwanensis]SPA20929.1 hypothetical protein CBM2631_B50041 [Cupriavidus taiwanensis]SPD56149.1 protein of unknown function [Cupriavidus taiwanensis]